MPPVKRPIHSAQRAIADITLGVAKSRQKKARRDAELGLQEFMIHFQSSISGSASATPVYATVDITFDYDFYYAPGNRDSDLERPQFWFGIEADVSLMATASVRSWVDDENTGATVGATVEVGVIGSSEYTGVVHMTFQGFGAVNDGDSPDDDLA